MLQNQRREKIIELIKESGHVKVADLSKYLNVTEVTIRQDLEHLEFTGLIEREHGGAFLKDIGKHGKSIALQNQSNIPQKIVIARRVVEFINNGDTIILDCGSTMTEVAKLLVYHKDLIVITNALNIALILGSSPGITLIITGGEFKVHSLSLTGQKAADFIDTIHVDKLFLAAAGIDIKEGLTYPNISDICVKKSMIKASNKVFLVTDSSKIGTNSFARLGPMSIIDCLITDSDISKKNLTLLNEQEVNFVIAEME